MPARDSRKIIFIAIIANLAIAGLKLFAATVTKSSAMLAEAIHSAAAFGGGLSIYEGMSRPRHPILPEHVMWNCLVLAGAAAFEFYSWQVSYRELRTRKDPDETVFDEIIGSKDPTVFTVFLEDSAGLAGTVLAFLGILMSRVFNNPHLIRAPRSLSGFSSPSWHFCWAVRRGPSF